MLAVFVVVAIEVRVSSELVLSKLSKSSWSFVLAPAQRNEQHQHTWAASM